MFAPVVVENSQITFRMDSVSRNAWGYSEEAGFGTNEYGGGFIIRWQSEDGRKISFQNDLLPVIQQNCSACHTSQSAIPFWEDETVLQERLNQVLEKTSKGQMPKGLPKLDDALIELFYLYRKQL